jgi:hypothetical protein
MSSAEATTYTKESGMIVTVLQRHIDKGVPGDCHCCPLAKAISEATGLNFMVIVFGAHCGNLHVDLPKIARDFRYSFDEGEKVEPFQFEIDYCPSVCRFAWTSIKSWLRQLKPPNRTGDGRPTA